MDLKVPKSFTHKINILFQGFTKYYFEWIWLQECCNSIYLAERVAKMHLCRYLIYEVFIPYK